MGEASRCPPFLGFEESDMTDWSPRARGSRRSLSHPTPRDGMNRPTRRQHLAMLSPGDSDRIHAGSPQRFAHFNCVSADDRPDCQRRRPGVDSTPDAIGRGDSPSTGRNPGRMFPGTRRRRRTAPPGRHDLRALRKPPRRRLLRRISRRRHHQRQGSWYRLPAAGQQPTPEKSRNVSNPPPDSAPEFSGPIVPTPAPPICSE